MHGPRCIEVAVELLADPDSRIRLGALTALLDRGFGRPTQPIVGEDGNSVSFLHLVAMKEIGERILLELAQQRNPVIEGQANNGAVVEVPTSVVDLTAPATE